MDLDDTISPAEVARRLGVAESTVRQMVRDRRVPHIRLGRVVRFSEQNYADILAAHTVPAASMQLTPRSLAARTRKTA